MRLEYKVDREISIKEYIVDAVSRKFFRHLKTLNVKYYVNGTEKRSHEILKNGDILEIIYDDDIIDDPNVYEMDIDILYQNDDFMIINKPKGLKSIPTGYNDFKSLYNAINYYFKKNNINQTIHFINRLDKDTEGILVVAKNKYMASILSANLDNINRYYLALVEGDIKDDGKIDMPISRESSGIKRMVDDSGKESITEYKVLKRYGDKTLLELHLLSGRCHQIRVHMSYIGHPIVGDPLYGNGDNLHLTSYKIEMVNPTNNELINISIDPSWINKE